MNNNSNLESVEKEFRKIKSLYYLYEISDDGRIFRNVKSKKILKQYKNNQGYWFISVSIKEKKIYKTVHSIVAECWLGDKPTGYEIDHIDRDKNNNDYRNLRYVTHSYNNINRKISWNIPVQISNDYDNQCFTTLRDCAVYISNQVNKSYKSIRWKLSKRRHNIFGYNIVYSTDAETGHANSTE